VTQNAATETTGQNCTCKKRGLDEIDSYEDNCLWSLREALH